MNLGFSKPRQNSVNHFILVTFILSRLSGSRQILNSRDKQKREDSSIRGGGRIQTTNECSLVILGHSGRYNQGPNSFLLQLEVMRLNFIQSLKCMYSFISYISKLKNIDLLLSKNYFATLFQKLFVTDFKGKFGR